MNTPTQTKQDHISLSLCAAALGRAGGSAKSPRKAKSSRKNGKLGGNPAWLAMKGKMKGTK